MKNSKQHSVQALKKQVQKGFTFVELLVIMVIIAIIGGIGIQFVLSTQEDKARLTNARTFFSKDFPNAVLSCMVRKNEPADCTDVRDLLVEDLDPLTEWGDKWSVVIPAPADADGVALGSDMSARVIDRSIVLCYPMEEVAIQDRQKLQQDIIEYMDDETSWTRAGANNQGQGFIVASQGEQGRVLLAKINGNVPGASAPNTTAGAADDNVSGAAGTAPAICGGTAAGTGVDDNNIGAFAQDALVVGGDATMDAANARPDYIQMMYVMRRP